MFKATLAQEILFAICANGNSRKDYKAPHAMRGTPPRPRRSINVNLPKTRAYKGHRP